MRLLYRKDDGSGPKWYVLDDIAWQEALDGTLNSTGWAIDVQTFMRKHLTMFSFESMQQDTTFEF